MLSRSSLRFARRLSSASLPQEAPRLQRFRTEEEDPTRLSSDHLGQFYRMNGDDRKRLFQHGGLPPEFELMTKTFQETCLMVRRPALEVATCVSSIDLSRPPVRFVLYGPRGSGKSLSLAHVAHHAYRSGYLLVHVPSVAAWTWNPKEYNQSEKFEGKTDLNLDACDWLVHFRHQNGATLDALTTGEDHVWNRRESTRAGSKLTELIEHGLNRIKYASEVVLALTREVKRSTDAGLVKTAVLIDGFDGLFRPDTRVYTYGKKAVHPRNFTFTEGFLSLTRCDWRNAVVVVTVGQAVRGRAEGESYLPRYLLGADGFNHLDPFVPVKVDNFSDKELGSMLDYYSERRWVTPHPKLEEEVRFLSGSNPMKVMEVCAKM